MKINLPDNIDSIVMLTASNWKTELRSNRYHYATRFAKTHQVIFVQPDLLTQDYHFEDTGYPNIVLLHVFDGYGRKQSEILTQALNEKNIRQPMLWIYNALFWDFISNAHSSLSIYHASEAYLSNDMPSKYEEGSKSHFCLLRIIEHVDLIVSVSDGVEESILSVCNVHHKSHVITNGCDYEFYAEGFLQNTPVISQPTKKIVFYQGNIYNKLNFPMLLELATDMIDWQFDYCGPVVLKNSTWHKLSQLKNVNYLGVLTPEEIRAHSQHCTVGIIPFGRQDFLSKRSFPLKAFEYLACGLPVISSTIDALKPFSDVFLFADSAQEFKLAMLKAVELKKDPHHLAKRLEAASKQSYNIKFQTLVSKIVEQSEKKYLKSGQKLNILVLYDPKSMKVPTVKAHAGSFEKYSSHNVYYAPATADFEAKIDLYLFDVILIHYSVRLIVTSGFYIPSGSIANQLATFPGLKILFIQDEYDSVSVSWGWIKKLGIQTIYTCVPKEFWQRVYPEEILGKLNFVHNLTGYVPEELTKLGIKPIEGRKTLIGYRGRNLPFWYGDLGQEKEFIGIKMREICEERGLPIDIEWIEEKRIYGPGWYNFLSSAKSTLGTESGCNVFDFDGTLSSSIRNFLSDNPNANYETVRKEFLEDREGKITMNQISPKIFEAIALRTALILFEGTYSDVVKPDIHFIPLKKDFSNIEEVLMKLQDDNYLKQMTDRAYIDVIESERYSYLNFVRSVDAYLEGQISKSKGEHLFATSISYGTCFSFSASTTVFALEQFPLNQFITTNSVYLYLNEGGESLFRRLFKKFLYLPLIRIWYRKLMRVPFLRPILNTSKKLIQKFE